MATQVDLGDGKIVRRAWDGRRFRFEIIEGAKTIILRPSTFEAKQLSMLFSGDDLSGSGKQEIDE